VSEQRISRMRIRASRPAFLALEARFLAGADDSGLEGLVPLVKKRGFVTRGELLEICRWKSPRTLPLVERNEEADVREVTAWALVTRSERLRIGSLLLLQGVSWPTASVILHFFHSDPYPVLDVRAAWSLGMESPSGYSFELWWRYVRACRALALRLSLSMRSVDRALWQYSRENATRP
jgi:hypothetical protein